MTWARNSKFGNALAKSEGRSFHSKLEASVDGILRMREKAGEIKIIGRQVTVPLYVNGVKVCSWIADFEIEDLKANEERLVEGKGFEDAIWKLKKKLYLAVGTKKVEMWGGTAARPVLMEILVPKGVAA